MLELLVLRYWLFRNRTSDLGAENVSIESTSILVRVWKRWSLLFLAIPALYKIIPVSFVRDDPGDKLPFELLGMSWVKLEKFVVSRESALETIFLNLALPNETARNTRPWKAFPTFDEVLGALRESKDESPEYILSFDRTAKYGRNTRGLCAKIAAEESNETLSNYFTVWYYSSHVGLDTRNSIDVRFSRLREEGRIQRLIDEGNWKVPLSCRSHSYRISIFALIVPPSFVLCPAFMLILTTLIVRKILQRREQMELDEQLPVPEQMPAEHVKIEYSCFGAQKVRLFITNLRLILLKA